MAVSKNNPTNRVVGSGKHVTSFDCEQCKDQCPKGKNYLKVFSQRGSGNGVMCEKK